MQCQLCGKSFLPKKNWSPNRKYCSEICRIEGKNIKTKESHDRIKLKKSIHKLFLKERDIKIIIRNIKNVLNTDYKEYKSDYLQLMDKIDIHRQPSDFESFKEKQEDEHIRNIVRSEVFRIMQEFESELKYNYLGMQNE